VVLGDNAEVNLIRAMAADDDLSLFLTRPWSLFFLIVAAFSVIFPWYQSVRSQSRWTLFYMPAVTSCLALPMFMMGGSVRPLIGSGLLLLAGWMLWRRWRSGWVLPASAGPALREG